MLTEEEAAARAAAILRGESPIEVHQPGRASIEDAFATVRADVQADTHAVELEVARQRTASYQYIRPFIEAAEGLIDVFQNTEGRYMFGLTEVDLLVRGVGRGELCYVTGFAHSGKTQVFLTSLLANDDRPILFFTLDETAELVLTKLVCMTHGLNAEELEAQVKAGNPTALEKVRSTARKDFAHLLVVDQAVGFEAMSRAFKEAEDYFGREIGAVGVDFLDLVPDEGSDVEKKSQALKRWTKDHDVPVICLHQGSRGNSGKGQELGLQAMKYAGEAEANFVIGVRRLRDQESLDSWERHYHQNTVNVSVIKNKRPPSKKGEVTFYLDPSTGLVRPLEDGDLGNEAPVPRSKAETMRVLLTREDDTDDRRDLA